MELKVKQKMINEKKVMGIIDENLKEIAPFEFKNIVEVEIHGYKYFICEKEDGTCSLYDENGYCRISFNDGYKQLKVLKCSCSDNLINVFAKKNDEVGILSSRLEWKNGLEKPSGIKVEVAYKFGKCDEIREYDDETVELLKHTKGEDCIGYWYHENINELVEPQFLSYCYYTIKCSDVGLHSLIDKSGNKGYPSYELSDHIEYDKLTNNVELIKYSKLKNNKKVEGLKQKVYDSSKSSYYPSFKFDDFIPAVYSNISYDKEKQIFFLEQTINGQVKKGFLGVTFDWNLSRACWWIWGYPNFKKEITVPCEYDDIKIIDDNYAVLKKDEKYGLIQFSFGKSNGDWDSFDNRNVTNGKYYEMVPCIYDSILKVNNCFIGKINNEERIITDFIDGETKQTVVIENNYTKVNQIFDGLDKVFLCDLENGKKEVVVIKSHRRHYKWEDKLCSISKISSCDNAEVIRGKYDYLIRVTNDNIVDVYFVNDKKNVEKLKSNIANIKYDLANEFYVITNNSGHICVMNFNNVIFSTDKLGLEPNNLSVSYLKGINKFKVTNNNLTKIYSSLNSDDDNKIYENRLFSYFDTLQTYYHTFIGYVEILNDSLITKLSRVDEKDKTKEIVILKGNIQVENIVSDGKRIIFSIIDSKTGQKKCGVIESKEGNICIDCVYNNIQYDSKNQVFICDLDGDELVFDIDGFVNEDISVKRVSCDQYELKLFNK